MNICSVYFILIQLCGIKIRHIFCLFEFQMPFSQNDAISKFIFFLVCRVIFSLQSCVIYHFKGNLV